MLYLLLYYYNKEINLFIYFLSIFPQTNQRMSLKNLCTRTVPGLIFTVLWDITKASPEVRTSYSSWLEKTSVHSLWKPSLNYYYKCVNLLYFNSVTPDRRTCIALKITKRYWKTKVAAFCAKIPKIHVSPRMGSKNSAPFSPAL